MPAIVCKLSVPFPQQNTSVSCSEPGEVIGKPLTMNLVPENRSVKQFWTERVPMQLQFPFSPQGSMTPGQKIPLMHFMEGRNRSWRFALAWNTTGNDPEMMIRTFGVGVGLSMLK